MAHVTHGSAPFTCGARVCARFRALACAVNAVCKVLLEVNGFAEVLDGLLSYSERHYARVDRLLRSTFLADYMLASMRVLQPLEDTHMAPLNGMLVVSYTGSGGTTL